MKLLIIVLIVSCLLSCQKNFTVEDNPTNAVIPFADDTSKIFTVIDYYYNGGVITDSLIKILKNATVNGQKKITLTEILASAGDTFYTVYKYNTANQLTEIKSVYNNDPTQFERDQFYWNGDNLVKYQYDSTGVVKRTYNFTYTPIGTDIKINFTQTPSQDTMFTGGSITSIYSSAVDFFVRPDFTPVKSLSKNHSYEANIIGTGLPYNSWDTTNIFFNIINGDLVKESIYRSGSDTNSTISNQTNRNKDTSFTFYNRSVTDNNFFTGKLKSLLGEKLYTIKHFLNIDFIDYILPESFTFEKSFNSRALVTKEFSHVIWQNGMFQFSSGPVPILENRYTHFFDNQNRLVRSLRYANPTTNVVTEGMKIIYP